MINPPYSQGSKQNPDLYEINFIKHLLDSFTVGGKCIAIIPQSSMTGKTKEESLQKSYDSIKKINFEKMYYRRDIGFDL